jgi:4-amino-4-deoxy-L-arabinose transferase-like glycosyltransferase
MSFFQKTTIKNALMAILSGVLLGAAAAAFMPGAYATSFLVSALLLSAATFILIVTWRWAGGQKGLAAMMAAAFLVRMVVGIGMSAALPAYGYDNEQQKAGYLFTDAYRRDNEAWGLRLNQGSLWQVMRSEFDTDQYGGLLVVSGMVYRGISPDAHRPQLIVMLGAFLTALGLPFFWRASRGLFSEKISRAAGWIYALYPDAILYGSSQLREPFMIGLFAVAFWAVSEWKTGDRWRRLLAFGLSAAGMLVISSRIALMVLLALMVWFWVVNTSPRQKKLGWLGWAAISAASLVLAGLFWVWMRESLAWDMTLAMQNSGWVAKLIEGQPRVFQMGFITVYGLLRPLLPAAIADPSNPIWKTIAITRAAGWYVLAPFLLYSPIALMRKLDRGERRRMLVMVLTLLLWIVISSLRAGGDDWDNPRYRIAFMPWLALAAPWALAKAREARDAWLARLIAVEMVFLLFFTNWYFSRYFNWFGRLPFWTMIAWIVGLSGLIVVGGIVWDSRAWLARKFQKSK